MSKEPEYTAILIRATPQEIRDIKIDVLTKYPKSDVKVGSGISFEDATKKALLNPIGQTGLRQSKEDGKYHQEPDYD